MEFAHPQWLAFLILVPLLGVWEWWRARRKAGLRFSNIAAAKAAPRTLWTYLGGMPTLLRMVALALGILDSLNKGGHKAAPPTVYRALEFLIEAELVHRLDSLNAFVGCSDPGVSHSGQFLICRSCRSVAELDDTLINVTVDKMAAGLGFTAISQTLEIQGLCQTCRESGKN